MHSASQTDRQTDRVTDRPQYMMRTAPQKYDRLKAKERMSKTWNIANSNINKKKNVMISK